jgi:hypothetical protein
VHFFGMSDSAPFAAIVVVNAHIEDETFLYEKKDRPKSRKHENVF